MISTWWGFAKQLQLLQDGTHHIFFLLEHQLLLSQIFLMFKPLKQTTHFVSGHIDVNTLGLGRTCHFWGSACQVFHVVAFPFLWVDVKRRIWLTCCCRSGPRPHIVVNLHPWLRTDCHEVNPDMPPLVYDRHVQPCWSWHRLAQFPFKVSWNGIETSLELTPPSGEPVEQMTIS